MLLAPMHAFAQRGDDIDQRPYDDDMVRLAEILGALHYLSPLCSGDDGPWRDQMSDLLEAEGPSEVRRARMVEGFNRGFRGFQRTYRSCTDAAAFIVDRYLDEGNRLADDIATRHGG
ncbi:MAG: TIGR02301 family protein [Pseudomonadota bacterium]